MSVFDLSEVQANYILEMPLRRLTKFSRIELEKEQSELQREIEELDAILADESLLRSVVSGELAEVAKTFGTPRRTVLLESAGAPAATAVPLEVADDPCLVYLSATGLMARSTTAETPGTGETRSRHDVVVSVVRSTARGDVGLLTSTGRVLRVGVLDLPALPDTAHDPRLVGAIPVTELASLRPGERAVALTSLSTDGPGLALGTRDGVVKRVNPEVLTNRDEWEVIGLKEGDEVVGAAELTTGEETLCFVSSDAQLLHFPAALVRPQGRGGGGMAGIRLAAGQRVVSFGVLDGRRLGAGDGVGVLLRPPGHRGRLGQGDPVRRVPRQGPGHRRGPLPPVPQGRGRPGLRLGGDVAGPRLRGQRRTGRPAGGGRPPGRLRHPRLPADRRLRRAGGPPSRLSRRHASPAARVCSIRSESQASWAGSSRRQ